MNIKGVAPSPMKLNERAELPSVELVYLAKKALEKYRATHLVTSLEPGWEQALAKAAVELGLPMTVALPYPGRDAEWKRGVRTLYLDLLARAEEVYRISGCYYAGAILDGHRWQIDQADRVLALWDYEFYGNTFTLIEYASKQDVRVINLWEDWSHLFSLRRRRVTVIADSSRRGAQIFDRKG